MVACVLTNNRCTTISQYVSLSLITRILLEYLWFCYLDFWKIYLFTIIQEENYFYSNIIELSQLL